MRSLQNEYKKMNERLGKKQYLVPYLMSSHPGSDLKEAVELAEYMRDLGLYAGTGTGFLSDTVHHFYLYVLYRTGSTDHDSRCTFRRILMRKQMQRALIQYRDPKNYQLVKEALIKAGREDLIGFDSRCLIPPRPMQHGYGKASAQNRNGMNKQCKEQ